MRLLEDCANIFVSGFALRIELSGAAVDDWRELLYLFRCEI